MKHLVVLWLALPSLCFSQLKGGVDNLYPHTSYTAFLAETKKGLENLRAEYIHQKDHPDSILDATGYFLCESLVHGGFHYWVGTPWDFNGYTNVPKQGSIACGYFVSTTLKHLGFHLNRYKLAQKAAMDEAIYLCGKEHMTVYRSISQTDLKNHFSMSYKPGIYLLGLANHVGYLYWDTNELYFIHSNYGTPYSVVIEPFCTSEVSASSIYVVGEISTNHALMRKWLENEPIPIP